MKIATTKTKNKTAKQVASYELATIAMQFKDYVKERDETAFAFMQKITHSLERIQKAFASMGD
jgi:hypothetical protein